jgi:hypothetical protein
VASQKLYHINYQVARVAKILFSASIIYLVSLRRGYWGSDWKFAVERRFGANVSFVTPFGSILFFRRDFEDKVYYSKGL